MMKCYHLDTFFLFTILINLCYLDLCFSEKNSSRNQKNQKPKKVVKTWKTDFRNGFENWTVKKDSPWIIEKWDDVLVKHNHTHLRFHNGAKPFTLFSSVGPKAEVLRP